MVAGEVCGEEGGHGADFVHLVHTFEDVGVFDLTWSPASSCANYRVELLRLDSWDNVCLCFLT